MTITEMAELRKNGFMEVPQNTEVLPDITEVELKENIIKAFQLLELMTIKLPGGLKRL